MAARRYIPALPRFDPESSLREALRVLKNAGVEGALVGRIAVWIYVPPEGRQFTSDVDFAVPFGYIGAVGKSAAKSGYMPQDLRIGGLTIQGTGIAIDFIDATRVAPDLYTEAVEKADIVRIGKQNIPIVPIEYLIATKLASPQLDDERDVEELLKVLPNRSYSKTRNLVVRLLGPALAEKLDYIARRVGRGG